MRRSSISKVCLSSFCVLPFWGFAQKRPHIILIFTDQQNVNAMSAAGNQFLYTPNMDALASDGIRFTNVYCTSPVSGPSRELNGMITQNWGKTYKPSVTYWERMAIGQYGQGNGIFLKFIRSVQKRALNICMVLNYSLFGTRLTGAGCWGRKQTRH